MKTLAIQPAELVISPADPGEWVQQMCHAGIAWQAFVGKAACIAPINRLSCYAQRAAQGDTQLLGHLERPKEDNSSLRD